MINLSFVLIQVDMNAPRWGWFVTLQQLNNELATKQLFQQFSELWNGSGRWSKYWYKRPRTSLFVLTWIVSESTNGVPQDVYKKTLIVATVLREMAIVKLPIIYPALKALYELRDVCLSAGDSSC